METPSDSVALLTFPKFPKVPLELQRMIWENALPGAQVVEIEWSADLDDWFCPMHSGSKPCSHLSTCKESRAVYLKYWLPIFPYLPSNTHLFYPDCAFDFDKRSFRNALPYPKSPTSSASRYEMTTNHCYAKSSKNTAPKVVSSGYFNPSIDTLFVANSEKLYQRSEERIPDLSDSPNLSGVRFLTLDEEYLTSESIEIQQAVVTALLKLQRLETVSVVSNDQPWIRRRRQNTLPHHGAITFRELFNRDRQANLSNLNLPGIQALPASSCAKHCPGREVKFRERLILRGGTVMSYF
ncbi:hypothetical protein DL98DRAFT_589781 [Cadophora sp. DSE1049]|nr:hypothetical protein DL98DRAFT_589781 [Cadophora sp. DSE1049]